MIGKLYISTVDYDWNGNDSTLVDRHNLDKIIKSVNVIDCHTSVEDLFCENIGTACRNANEIVLVDVESNIAVTNDTCFSYGRLFNELIKHKSKVKNFTWNKDFNYLKNTRTVNTPVLWTAGCSITAGVGVDHAERWGTLLSASLSLPEVTLSQPGASIYWAADQILRSDIKEGDTVVWGLTNLPRVTISKDWNFETTTIRHYTSRKKEEQYWTIDYFESETQVLSSLREILQVINFCQKIKANLYLVNLFDIAWVKVALHKFKNFIDLTQNVPINNSTLCFTDVGTDNEHPGPKQHQEYATKIYNLIKENNHGKTI
jgi:hypothetical protein